AKKPSSSSRTDLKPSNNATKSTCWIKAKSLTKAATQNCCTRTRCLGKWRGMPSQTKYASIQSLNNHQQSIAVMNDDTETWLKALQKAPLAANQRTLAKKLGFSVGKTNYILK